MQSTAKMDQDRGSEDVEDENNDDDVADQESSFEPLLKFRNYTLVTKFLDGMYSTEKAEPESITSYIEDKLELAQRKSCDNEANKDNPFKIDPKLLEPKKVDWDLKRRIEKRLEKLERETRKCIDKQIKNRGNKAG